MHTNIFFKFLIVRYSIRISVFSIVKKPRLSIVIFHGDIWGDRELLGHTV